MASIFHSISGSMLLNVAALILYGLIVRRITAFSFVFVGLLMLEGLHMGIEFLMASFYNEPAYSTLIYYSWYLSFAVTDFLYVALVITLCRKSNLNIDKVSYFILGLYCVMGLIQLVRLLERLFIDSEMMSWFYSQSIPFINTLVGFVLLGFVCKIIFQNMLSNFRTL